MSFTGSFGDFTPAELTAHNADLQANPQFSLEKLKL